MRRDPIRLLLDSVGDYGEIVHFRMLHRHVVVLAAPDHVRHVFQDNYRNYSKQTPGFKVLRTFLANGLLTNEGDAWLRQRRIAQPAFHRERIAGFADTITTAAEALAERWNASDHTVVNLTAEMTQLTLRIVGETLLSTDVSREVDRIGQALTSRCAPPTDRSPASSRSRSGSPHRPTAGCVERSPPSTASYTK